MRNPPNHSPIPARRFVLAVLFFIGISGCGGGGGSPPPANQAPVANNGCAYDPGVNQPFNGTLSATDPEGQSLSYSVVSNGSKGSVTVNASTGAFTYTPTNLVNSRGAGTFTFRACETAPSTLCSNVATYKIVHTPRIMPLGDSITDGAVTSGSPLVADRVGYRKPLKEALTAAGYVTDFVGTQISGSALLTDPEHEGHGGITAGQVNTSLGAWLNSATPDVVLLHIGTNDLTPAGDQSGNWTGVQNIRNTINNWITSNWPVTVIYARIINTNPATTETTTFNNNVRDNVVQPAINIGEQAILVDHESALSVSSDYGDNLHPSATGYAKMANVWLRPLTGTGTPSPGDRYPPSLPPGFLPKCP